jgi:hypothetical protein
MARFRGYFKQLIESTDLSFASEVPERCTTGGLSPKAGGHLLHLVARALRWFTARRLP